MCNTPRLVLSMDALKKLEITDVASQHQLVFIIDGMTQSVGKTSTPGMRVLHRPGGWFKVTGVIPITENVHLVGAIGVATFNAIVEYVTAHNPACIISLCCHGQKVNAHNVNTWPYV